MRIYLIIVEELFFHPSFVREILEARGKEIIGISAVADKSKQTFVEFLFYQIHFWGWKGFFILSFLKVLYAVAAHMKRFFPIPGDYEVQEVAKRFGIPCRAVNNVNAPEHLEHLKSQNIDVIVSANGQIFKDPLLNIPKIGCINRHSALLPKYGGVWPIFWALAHQEEKVGVSVHWMTPKIDAGDILAFEEISVTSKDTLYSLYQRAFQKSAGVVLKALKQIETKAAPAKRYQVEQASYFRAPKREELKSLRAKMRVKVI